MLLSNHYTCDFPLNSRHLPHHLAGIGQNWNQDTGYNPGEGIISTTLEWATQLCSQLRSVSCLLSCFNLLKLVTGCSRIYVLIEPSKWLNPRSNRVTPCLISGQETIRLLVQQNVTETLEQQSSNVLLLVLLKQGKRSKFEGYCDLLSSSLIQNRLD